MFKNLVKLLPTVLQRQLSSSAKESRLPGRRGLLLLSALPSLSST